jgi:putative cofactor-binding repeat protein
MGEDHNCANLIPLGARTKSRDVQTEKARQAFSKLKAWGREKQSTIVTATKPKPSTAAQRVIATNTLKKTAKGDAGIAVEKRVYLYVEAEAALTTSKFPKGEFFYNKEWSVGRVLDAAAKGLQIQNVNNRGGGEEEKLRVFHVEGGRLLEFGEKLGEVAVSGNTVVLLRGIGPAVPDLIKT